MNKLSICIPVYNSENSIAKLCRKLFEEFKDESIEVILVNDCSRDKSAEICTQLALDNEKIKFINLRKNSGEHNAVLCALNFVTGDAAVIIDDDFQNPPSEIRKLVTELRAGKDVVFSKYEKKQHHLFRNLGSKLNDLMANWVLEKPADLYLSSFKAISKDTVNAIKNYKGPFPYIDGLLLQVTNNFSSVVVKHEQRQDGRSNYTLKKLVSLWLNMFINFSVKPLRVFTVLGIFSFIISLLFMGAITIEKFIYPETPLGWTSIMVCTMLFSSIQILFLGLLSEYIGKIYLSLSFKPQFTVKYIIQNKSRI